MDFDGLSTEKVAEKRVRFAKDEIVEIEITEELRAKLDSLKVKLHCDSDVKLMDILLESIEEMPEEFAQICKKLKSEEGEKLK